MLIQKIEGVCKDIEKNLAKCFERSSASVADFAVSTANKVESEFVDTIVLNIDKIKIHLTELKTALNQKTINDLEGVEKIV